MLKMECGSQISLENYENKFEFWASNIAHNVWEKFQGL